MDSAPQPTNDHERTIAAAIESKLLVPDSAYDSIVAEVAVCLPFAMSIAALSSYSTTRIGEWLSQRRSNPHAGLCQKIENAVGDCLVRYRCSLWLVGV